MPETKLSYYNMIDIQEGFIESEFIRTLNIKVVGAFHNILSIGDYAPSYWVDSANNTVYIGTELKNGMCILYKSVWYEDQSGAIRWNGLVAIK